MTSMGVGERKDLGALNRELTQEYSALSEAQKYTQIKSGPERDAFDGSLLNVKAKMKELSAKVQEVVSRQGIETLDESSRREAQYAVALLDESRKLLNTCEKLRRILYVTEHKNVFEKWFWKLYTVVAKNIFKYHVVVIPKERVLPTVVEGPQESRQVLKKGGRGDGADKGSETQTGMPPGAPLPTVENVKEGIPSEREDKPGSRDEEKKSAVSTVYSSVPQPTSQTPPEPNVETKAIAQEQKEKEKNEAGMEGVATKEPPITPPSAQMPPEPNVETKAIAQEQEEKEKNEAGMEGVATKEPPITPPSAQMPPEPNVETKAIAQEQEEKEKNEAGMEGVATKEPPITPPSAQMPPEPNVETKAIAQEQEEKEKNEAGMEGVATKEPPITPPSAQMPPEPFMELREVSSEQTHEIHEEIEEKSKEDNVEPKKRISETIRFFRKLTMPRGAQIDEFFTFVSRAKVKGSLLGLHKKKSFFKDNDRVFAGFVKAMASVVGSSEQKKAYKLHRLKVLANRLPLIERICLYNDAALCPNIFSSAREERVKRPLLLKLLEECVLAPGRDKNGNELEESVQQADMAKLQNFLERNSEFFDGARTVNDALAAVKAKEYLADDLSNLNLPEDDMAFFENLKEEGKNPLEILAKAMAFWKDYFHMYGSELVERQQGERDKAFLDRYLKKIQEREDLFEGGYQGYVKGFFTEEFRAAIKFLRARSQELPENEERISPDLRNLSLELISRLEGLKTSLSNIETTELLADALRLYEEESENKMDRETVLSKISEIRARKEDPLVVVRQYSLTHAKDAIEFVTQIREQLFSEVPNPSIVSRIVKRIWPW